MSMAIMANNDPLSGVMKISAGNVVSNGGSWRLSAVSEMAAGFGGVMACRIMKKWPVA